MNDLHPPERLEAMFLTRPFDEFLGVLEAQHAAAHAVNEVVTPQRVKVFLCPLAQGTNGRNGRVLILQREHLRHLVDVRQFVNGHHLVNQIGQEGAIRSGECNDLRFGEFEFHVSRIIFFDRFVNGLTTVAR